MMMENAKQQSEGKERQKQANQQPSLPQKSIYKYLTSSPSNILANKFVSAPRLVLYFIILYHMSYPIAFLQTQTEHTLKRTTALDILK